MFPSAQPNCTISNDTLQSTCESFLIRHAQLPAHSICARPHSHPQTNTTVCPSPHRQDIMCSTRSSHVIGVRVQHIRQSSPRRHVQLLFSPQAKYLPWFRYGPRRGCKVPDSQRRSPFVILQSRSDTCLSLSSFQDGKVLLSPAL